MRSFYLYGLAAGFVSGIALESVFGFGFPFAAFFIFIAAFLLIGCEIRTRTKRSFFVSFVLFFCALGILRVDVFVAWRNDHILDDVAGKKIVAAGVLIQEPDIRDQYAKIVVAADKISFANKEISPRAFDDAIRIAARVPLHPRLSYGDYVAVSGTIAVPKGFSDGIGGRAFDYSGYLAKDGIYYEILYPDVEVAARGKGNPLFRILFAVRDNFLSATAKLIPEPEASLAAGILFGAQQSLGKDLLQKFRETGVAHIVVLSGYNIAIVAAAISRALVPFPFSWRIFGSAAGIVLFALMSGGGSTVARAAIMALIIILARAFGRTKDALRALCFAGVLMLAWNPMILFHDISFQLSFAATFAIIALVPVIEKFFLFIPPRFLIREIVVATIATQIFVFPIVLYHIGTLSLVGVAANFLVLPVVPLAMLFVFFASGIGVLSLSAGAVFAPFSYAILWYIIATVEFFAALPFAAVTIEKFPLLALFFSYICIFGFMFQSVARAKQQNIPRGVISSSESGFGF